jgi:uncharacterized protein YqiB (DUF1249 family)
MLCEANIKVSWRTCPRGFTALMGLYESNYLRFTALAGDPVALRGSLLSRVAGDCDLLLTVVEHMRYTTTLCLTYQFGDDQSVPERAPDLRLRAYHDARLLEAEQFRAPAHLAGGPNMSGAPAERELHQRWQRNMMLNKWLEYCAERGHRFARQASS